MDSNKAKTTQTAIISQAMPKGLLITDNENSYMKNIFDAFLNNFSGNPDTIIYFYNQ